MTAAEIGVVVPTFGEAETIVDVVRDVEAELQGQDWTLLVVDDTPTDETVRALACAVADHSRVNWLHRRGDGLSSAVVRGFDEIDADAYVVMDGDGQHPAGRVPELAGRVLQSADLAVGSRHLAGGGVDGDWPLHRQAISFGAESLARVAVPTARRLSDPMSGFFAVDADVLDAVRPRLRPHGYKILLEIAARAPVQEIHEVPIQFAARKAGESNLGMREYGRYVRHLGSLIVPARRESIRVVQGGTQA